MKLEELFKNWEAEDYRDWFSINLQRQTDACSVYPNLLFINKFTSDSTNISTTEIWQISENEIKKPLELLYRKEVLWISR